MFTVSDDLVVYGGDKSGLAVCTMGGADWKWAAPAITGRNPLFLLSSLPVQLALNKLHFVARHTDTCIDTVTVRRYLYSTHMTPTDDIEPCLLQARNLCLASFRA